MTVSFANNQTRNVATRGTRDYAGEADIYGNLELSVTVSVNGASQVS